jgi:acyl-CoA dehydrogenase
LTLFIIERCRTSGQNWLFDNNTVLLRLIMIPRTLFDADLEGFRDSVRKFLQQEAAPYHAQWEKDGQVSRELWTKAGELGFLCPTMPEEYGGAGADFRYSAVIMEEVSGAGLSGIGWTLHSDIVAPYILNYGSDAQKAHYLPKLVSGEMIGAIAMTEPGAGSDLQGIKTTAVKDASGEHYLLNGSKTFITNGQMADLVIVVAKTDPKEGAKGISLFMVEAAWEGFEKGQNLNKVGMKAQDTSELFFQDVKLPADKLLGAMEGQGFFQLMQELPAERLQVGLTAVAAAEAAWQWTLDYVKDRKAFGKPVIKFQNTRFKLAELKAEITAARVFCDRCLELHLDKKLDIPTAAMLKQYTTDLQCKVMDECVQLHGGYGYMWEYPIARAWADSRVQRIYAGTNEIMKEIVARSF